MGDALRASADQSGHNQRLSNRRKERRDLPSNGTEAERVSYNVYVNNARRRARRRRQQMCSPARCALPRHLRANKRGSSEPTALAPAKPTDHPFATVTTGLGPCLNGPCLSASLGAIN